MSLKEEDKPKHIQSFLEWAKNIKGNVAIFMHKIPDADSIASGQSMKWLLSKMGINSECFYTGCVSHPQNMAFVNLLDPDLKPLEEFDRTQFGCNIIVDCVPDGENAGIGDLTPKDFSLVIDHHKSTPNGGFKGTYINLKNGSCSATVYSLIYHSGYEFKEDNALDSKVATAMMIGIATDTDNLLADSCTEYEFEAYWKLFQYRDANALKEIIRFKRPKFWIDAKAEAATKAIIGDDGVAVVGIGLLPEKHYNLIADMADEMITWASVETSICFAIVDGENVIGSVRSTNSSVSVNELCAVLGGKHGSGGGRDGKGSYRYSIQGLCIEDDEDEETHDQMWDVVNRKETKRIFKIFKK